MGLSAKQTKAIQNLLTGATIQDAASMTGCSYSSLRKWLKQPDFVKEYSRAQTRIIESAVAKARNTVSPAIETLTKIMNDEAINPQSRIYAARSLLEFSLRLVELTDVLRKLEELEAWKEKQENECF